jgi:hypothetical protein
MPAYLTEAVSELLGAAVSDNTQISYKTGLAMFEKYCYQIFKSPPVYPASVTQILYFVAWLHSQNKSHNTINTYLAGISYHHRIRNFDDPTQFFIVKKLLKGAQHVSGKPDLRLPITPNILSQLVGALRHTVLCKYNRRMLAAMFTLSFFAFLRIGEITAKSSKASQKNLLQLHNISFEPQRKGSLLILTLHHFKHHDSCRPVCLQISPQNDRSICPVRSMSKYLKIRGNSNGPLFTMGSSLPVTSSFYSSELQNAISFIGLDCRRYKSHSFRIGAASHAFQSKIPEDQIRLMGRWNSSAVKRYFRIPVFNSLDLSSTVRLSEAADEN